MIIEDCDAIAKEPPHKVIRINTILADSQESGLTTKERKRKIAQATYVSQVTTGVPVTVDTPIIGFQKKDLVGLDLPHNDALVICIRIEQAEIERVHVDEGSAANILQLSVIQQMGLEPKISKLARSLTGFNGSTSITIGTIDLDVHSPPMDQGEGINLEDSLEKGWKPEEDVELVPLDPDQPDKKARIGSHLSPNEKVELTTFLQNNKDMFTWSPSDIPGIDPNVICHWLHVNPTSKPMVQKRRNFAPERVMIIEAEIDKLLSIGFIEEVSYSEWLANIVLVAKQENGKLRVCIDYTDLNKACPKDNFPLPRIDQLMDSTSGNQLLSFMDAYPGYNQIMMYDDDKAKTSFIIERRTYCYKVMPFGLKNAGVTYQRLANKIFKDLLLQGHALWAVEPWKST
ncbi:unnamed protein product [Prunus brigantina]